jgi:hypothetical protein
MLQSRKIMDLCHTATEAANLPGLELQSTSLADQISTGLFAQYINAYIRWISPQVKKRLVSQCVEP